ncbi:MAG: sterol desaturase family protein [Rhodobacteraceae bacterium]|nr:sterol desaturase family protein [Paracoccaceae bacterium]
MDWLFSRVSEYVAAPFDWSLRVSLYYICATIILAFGVWLWRGKPQSFVKFLVPKRVYTHKSNLLDIKIFLANRVMVVMGVFGPLVFSPVVAIWTVSQISRMRDAPPQLGGIESWQTMLAVTVIIVVTSDFCKYWAHRLHHDMPTLWPYHAVHHSAEVLTPLTVARVHPIEIALRNLLISLFVGLAQGIMLGLFVGNVSVLTIGGANIFYVLFNGLGSNLRHSHIWLSYGRRLEHIFISPAQHQIHHSMDVRHHNKNYGSIFAIWDWMFGTLYVPDGYEELRFGVSDAQGREIEQPYTTLKGALVKPFAESYSAMRGKPAESTQAGALPPTPTTPAE